MLSAVISCVKGNICYGQRTVDEQEGGLFQSFAVDIICNCAVHVPGEQGLQVGFVNPGIGSYFGDTDFFHKMAVNVGAGFFQIDGACGFGIFCKAAGQFQHSAEEEKPDKVVAVGACFLL